MTVESPNPEFIFGGDTETMYQRNADRLLANYSNPWDPIAEGVQNSVDAINRKYREKLASDLSMEREVLEDAIEQATERVVEIDAECFKEVSNELEFGGIDREGLSDGAKWGDDEYKEWIHDQYYTFLGEELDIPAGKARRADEQVRETYQGKIVVKRDREERKIEIKDNGIGMSPDDLGTALKRYGSFKSDSDKTTSEIGELGNGLTYMLTNCKKFRIESCDGEHISEAKISGMLNWVNDEISIEDVEAEQQPSRKTSDEKSFTNIEMIGIREGESDYPDLFDEKMNSERVIHMIRNKTAIGQLFDSVNYPAKHTLRNENVDVEYVEIGGVDGSQKWSVDFRFQGPAQVAAKAGEDESTRFPDQLTLSTAKQRVQSDTQTIGEKSVVTKGVWESPGGIKHYYEAFVASRGRYRGLSRNYELCNDPSGGVEGNKFDLAPGIEVSVKGMPCGFRVEPPAAGSAGYWGNFYVNIMNNELSFDEGREKPATGGRGQNFQECAKHVLFREIGTDVISGTTKGTDISPAPDETNIIEERISDREKLNFECLEAINFQHKPNTEQDVVAIFHEALASGLFPDNYQGLDTSTWHPYDEIYRYEAHPDDDIEILGSMVARSIADAPNAEKIDDNIIVEFKHEGDDILSDLSADKKIYSEIDMLICWDINQEKAESEGLSISPKEPDRIKYWGTTHTLKIDSHLLYDSSNEIEMIKLVDLFERIDNGRYEIH